MKLSIFTVYVSCLINPVKEKTLISFLKYGVSSILFGLAIYWRFEPIHTENTFLFARQWVIQIMNLQLEAIVRIRNVQGIFTSECTVEMSKIPTSIGT